MTLTLTPIGLMHCDLLDPSQAPKNYDESTHSGTLEIFAEFENGLKGIEAGHTIVALFWLDQAKRDILQVYPRGDKSRGLFGVFATRSPMRPNPIAVSELKVTAINGRNLTVHGVDVINQTPLLDLKRKI
ncbi:MAG: tRNA (N6-threonylcarbamoyladenosine(37)-N6)-methyltransferase TrmO [Proteobacteria bacterium]|nr:tRNA (N6-threonylcarbamoyladenosine(37)-N6)-methyltransferase TrmO [Desulfobulbaceae bacterium]MBU4151574.1 tRNA (N6-threonylcarbamoyladenosine(37)-N6)-methyltransferase TrmO [Pseudomonadota bacterium]MDP2106702.1 tRNA (N6-threonylcarbamoyladenosine(37)-N6)-methyltransferase TrmO [Desulfobulbaceae bacterium]